MGTRYIWSGRLCISQWNCHISLVRDWDHTEIEDIEAGKEHRRAGYHIDSFSHSSTAGKVWHYKALSDEEKFIPFDDMSFEEKLQTEAFISANDIEETWLDRAYNIILSSDKNRMVFNTIRHALLIEEKIAVGRMKLNNRDQAVLIDPRPDVMRLWTLHDGDPVWGYQKNRALTNGTGVDQEKLQALCQFIKTKSLNWENGDTEEAQFEKTSRTF